MTAFSITVNKMWHSSSWWQCCYAEWCYAKCHFTGCHFAQCCYAYNGKDTFIPEWSLFYMLIFC